MRCIFFMEDYPITPDSSGGAPALCYSHLELLAHMKAEVHLVLLSKEGKSLGFDEYAKSQPHTWNQVKSWCASHRWLEISPVERARAPLKNFLRALADPAPYVCAGAEPDVIATFREIYDSVNPDLIWAEHRVPATLALRAGTGAPVVYSHHDWEWRLGRLRYDSKKDAMGIAQKMRARFVVWLTKRVEESNVRGVAGCVSGSITEAAEFESTGARRVAYFPTTYHAIDSPNGYDPSSPVRVVHLGGMQGTRNQMSVERFLDQAWLPFCADHPARPELWLVGSMKGAPVEFMEKLERAGAICAGFVEDLRSVLRPYDIHVVPWELPTGTRTRIPVALNHSQALISTKASAVCLPELRNEENCILVDTLSEMGNEVATLVTDAGRRKRLAQHGRSTFLNHFTRESVQPQFRDFLNRLSENGSVVTAGA